MWAALRVRGGCERSVIAWIARHAHDGGVGYTPMKTVWRKVRSQRRTEIGSSRERIKRPYFSGYIFSTSLQHPPHTAFVLGADYRIVPMPDAEITRLQRAEENGDFDETAAQRLAVLLGIKIEFTQGPMAGQRATVTALLNGGKDVALDLAGRMELRLPLAKFNQISVRAS